MGRIVLAIVLLSGVACEHATAPHGKNMALSFGTSVSGSIARGDTAVYHIDVKAGQLFVIYVDAPDSAVTARVLDSKGTVLGTTINFGPRSPGSQWTPITAASDGTDTVRVTSPGLVAGGRFVLRPTLIVPTPEHVSGAITPNDTVVGESIDTPADVDDFTFMGTKGQVVNVFLQQLGTSNRFLNAYLYNDDAPPQPGSPPLPPLEPVAWITSAPLNADLEASATGRYTLPSNGQYRIRIFSGAVLGTDTSAIHYHLQLYVIDTLPEHVSAQITPGDTIAENIDHVGDIDTYTVSAAPGTRLNLFLAPSLPTPNTLYAVARDPGSGAQLAQYFVNPGAKLLDSPSGTFVVPAAGTVMVQVEEPSAQALYRGAYRLFVYQVNPAPETGPATLSLDGTPVSGTIDQYGDIDEYSFTLARTQPLTLRTSDASLYPTALRYDVIDNATGLSAAFGAGEGYLGPGSYRLRVDPGSGQQGSYRGPYQFVLSSPDTLPENVPPGLGANATITTETAAWPADVDRFVFSSASPDTIVFALTPPNDTSWQFIVRVVDLATGNQLAEGGSPGVTRLPRIDVPAGSRYQVEVQGVSSTWAPGSSAPYTLVTQRVSAAPEHASATIAMGDTIRDSLDYLGDIDDYHLAGSPGQEFNISVSAPAISFTIPSLHFTVTDAVTGAAIDSMVLQGLTTWSSTMRMPASGAVKIRVCNATACIAKPSDPPASYSFVVNAINRAPERLPATFTLGDSVKGEAIDFPGDVDEFAFIGAANQNVRVAFQYYTDGWQASPVLGLQLELIDPTSSTVLTTVTIPSAQLDDATLPTITLPHDGTYLVRIQDQVQLPYYTRNWGPYHFRIAAVP